MQHCLAILIFLVAFACAALPELSLSCDCSALESRSRRVVGGTVLPKNQRFPWMSALLDSENKLVGGATVLNERFLLTAAHVCSGTKASELIAFFGSNSIKESHLNNRLVKSSVLHCIMHPEFSPASGVNDIALLELQQPLDFSEDVAPVCLSNSSGTNLVFVSGWGRTDEREGGTSDDLRMAKLFKASLVHCQSKFGADVVQTNTVLCAIGNKRDACQGDSGGPLMENDTGNRVWSQIGVVSWGFGCGRAATPGIYSRISHYIPWIQQIASRICKMGEEEDEQALNSVR